MSYQALILGAGNSRPFKDTHFNKCRFLVNKNMSLLEESIASHDSASRIIVGLDNDDYNYFSKVSFNKNVRLLNIVRQTQGALATAGMCLDDLSDSGPIIVSAVDGICPNHMNDFFESMKNTKADGGAIVFPSLNPNYCYVRVSDGIPIEFAEKRRIGNLASAGVYYFREKKFLEESILWAILNQVKVNDLYYFSSAMNKLIFENRSIGLFIVNENDYLRFSTELEAKASLVRLRGAASG
jgi:hypothetical protein